jgi:hypothetical protein
VVIELPGQLLDMQSLVRDHGGIVGRLAFATASPGSARDALARSAISADRSAAISSGRSWRVVAMPESNHKSRRLAENAAIYPARCGRNVWRGLRSR